MSTYARVASRVARIGVVAFTALFAATASAQLLAPDYPYPVPNNGRVTASPAQNPLAPTGVAWQQANYPYEGQCLADAANNGTLFPLLATKSCAATQSSFACVSSPAGPHSAQTAASWGSCGAVVPFTPLQPIIADSTAAATIPTPRFQWPVLNPPDYTPDQTTFPGADYYEIGVHEAWGFQAIASAGLFPNPTGNAVQNIPVPNGMQWTGLVCTIPTGCTCPNGLADPFKTQYCSAAGKIPAGAPLFTKIWGVGQINMGGGPVTSLLGPAPGLGLFTPATAASAWSANNYIATWPSISIRGTFGRPVVVKWVNEFPNNHLFCEHPEAADWPCAIDRTFMGVKASIDPALGTSAVPPDGVNLYGSPQQPDNSWVTHLHGGEIPPSTDGFAEKWFGNSVTAATYAGVANRYVMPPFENPLGLHLKRPAGNSDTYTYPMVNEEALIWFHDHTLGKTHHNVIAGPAGFFPVREPAKHGGTGAYAGICPPGVATCTSEYSWLDPVTEPRDALGIPLFDYFFAIQDRAFNDDGSINFSNGLGQAVPVVGGVTAPPNAGYTPVTPGVNPDVHPTWIPEYFGDHALVNGVLWPKAVVPASWLRIRLANGSDSRCYTLGFQTTMPAPNAQPNPNIAFWIIANDQGYLQQPMRATNNRVTFCPGERVEFLLNFSSIRTPMSFYMTNEAGAPFPFGQLPYGTAALPQSPWPEMNVIMRFDVDPTKAGIKVCGGSGISATNNWNPQWTQAQINAAVTQRNALAKLEMCMPSNPATMVPPNPGLYQAVARPTALPQPGAPVPANWPAGVVLRQMYLNERVDGTTLAPLGMQINGVPFEYKVTETPKQNTTEVWQFINLTVDAHPMHPHFVRHLLVARQGFNAPAYKQALCGSTTCQPGPSPGDEMVVVPDVTPFLVGTPTFTTPTDPFTSNESGWKDAVQAPPNRVTTIIAKWEARWAAAATAGAANAPGTAGCPNGTTGCTAPYAYEPVSSGPYVWHCHINSHEDSEMMRTSLVVP